MNPNNENHPTIVNNNEMHNCNVFTGPVYGACFPLPGAQVTINQYADAKGNVKQEASGPIEPLEERSKRKEAAIKDMVRKLENLEVDMLGYTNQGKRITHIELSMLLHRCLGLGSIPSKQAYMPIQESLWSMLIDKRTRCTKDGKELYYPQTYLNIVGYLKEKEIIVNVQPKKLLNTLYPKAEQNLVENIKRAFTTSSGNPILDGVEEMFNFYIEQLKDGKI